MPFTASPEQQTIFSALATGSANLMIEAVAGSGKTTTIVEACRNHLPPGQSCRFLAFNKNIQEELARRLPLTITVTTFHSVGNSAIRKAWPAAQLDKDKSHTILKARLRKPEYFSIGATVARLVGYAKNVGLDPDAPTDSWAALALHYDLDMGDNDQNRIFEVAGKLLTTSSTTPVEFFDFDDMLYLPLKLQCSLDRSNFVFVDEAQDTNLVQRELLKRMLFPPPYGRLIAVGDPNQAIYGFRGADADAMSALKAEFSMLSLPLSVSYRCAKAVVREAQKYCST